MGVYAQCGPHLSGGLGHPACKSAGQIQGTLANTSTQIFFCMCVDYGFSCYVQIHNILHIADLASLVSCGRSISLLLALSVDFSIAFYGHFLSDLLGIFIAQLLCDLEFHRLSLLWPCCDCSFSPVWLLSPLHHQSSLWGVHLIQVLKPLKSWLWNQGLLSLCTNLSPGGLSSFVISCKLDGRSVASLYFPPPAY